jgi:putative oxidoreductase
MLAFMGGFQGQLYAVMRMVVGFLFLWHGSQKLFGFPGGVPEGVPPFVQYGAGGIELVGGVLVMIGLMTRPAAFLCSGTMAAAYWMVHGLKAPLPLENGGELAALYCFVFLFISARGAGVWSLDGARSESD